MEETVRNAASIDLDPLLVEEADELITSLLPGGTVDTGPLSRSVTRSGGTPAGQAVCEDAA